MTKMLYVKYERNRIKEKRDNDSSRVEYYSSIKKVSKTRYSTDYRQYIEDISVSDEVYTSQFVRVYYYTYSDYDTYNSSDGHLRICKIELPNSEQHQEIIDEIEKNQDKGWGISCGSVQWEDFLVYP